jgi:soluble lytic murein transglycosylase
MIDAHAAVEPENQAPSRGPSAPRVRPVQRVCAAFVLVLATTCEAPSASEADAGDLVESPRVDTAAPADVLDPAIAAPTPLVLRAARSIADGALADARTLADGGTADEQGVIRFRLARAYEAAGSVDAAIPLFEAVVLSGHPLALASRVEIGRIHTDPAAARVALEPACAAEWPGRAESCALLGLGSLDTAEAEARLEAAYAARTELRYEDRSTIVRELATRLAAHEETADRERAITILRDHGELRPSSATTADFDERAAAIVPSLPSSRRSALREVSTAQRLARAESLSRVNAHREAERIFHDVAHDTRPSDPAHCTALLGEGRAMFRRRARAEAAAHLDAMSDGCAREADADAHAWGLYFAAKSYSALGHNEPAVARYDELARTAPTHRLADDALLEAGMIELREGALDEARTRLTRLIDGPSDADMRPDGFFVLAWTEREAGAHDRALAILDRAIAESVPESREDLGGRFAYWRARELGALGRADEARAALEAIARDRPLSYYGRSARGRLDELGAAPAISVPDATPLTFARLPPDREDGLARALASLQAGEAPLAERELSALGLIGTGDADVDARWLGIALLASSGAHERAVTRARGPLVRSLLAHPIDGRARSLVAIAYPRGFADLIEPSAREASIESALVFGVIREESSFAPGAISIAHAYGLMQLIRPTAARLAHPLGLSADADALVRPEINVRLGTRYLGELSRRYDPGPQVIPAAYNAGQGAVDRWLREGDATSLDEFVENIPYAETRGYTRRVLQSWGVYQFLLTGEVAPLPSALPRAR